MAMNLRFMMLLAQKVPIAYKCQRGSSTNLFQTPAYTSEKSDRDKTFSDSGRLERMLIERIKQQQVKKKWESFQKLNRKENFKVYDMCILKNNFILIKINILTKIYFSCIIKDIILLLVCHFYFSIIQLLILKFQIILR